MGIFQLRGGIETNFTGYTAITNLYNKNRNITNDTIALDFYHCKWIDANLVALLSAVIYKMTAEQKVVFSADFDYLEKFLDVLFRNGFLIDGQSHPDEQKSTMPSRNFSTSDKIGFVRYVSDELLNHRGMSALQTNVSEQIKDDLLEIFTNTHLHANTEYPFFVGGQYYPRAQLLKFTLVDLGQGFLPKIQMVTKGNIKDSISSIKWALAGNTSKTADHCSGGLGLSSIYKYCQENNGTLEIITGDAYWSSSFNNTIYADGMQLKEEFVGTTINLFFSKV